MDTEFTITDYSPIHQPGIDLLLDSIQDEFRETIYGPGILKMSDAAAMPGRRYWVVLHGQDVIGSIGVVLLSGDNICLKSMLLQKKYRGGNLRIAARLLQTALAYGREQKRRQVFLGTMVQFQAAQSFYRKNGFVQITEMELPGDFMKNPVDKVFFKSFL